MKTYNAVRDQKDGKWRGITKVNGKIVAITALSFNTKKAAANEAWQAERRI